MSYPQPKLSRVSALKLVKFHKKASEDCSYIAADSVAPTESMNFTSLWWDSFTDEGYNLGEVAMVTLITIRRNASQLY